jgi:outer membrane protein TolC
MIPVIFLCGCQAMPSVDAPAEASRLSGISQAIVVRDWTMPEVTTAPCGAILTRNCALAMTLQFDPRIQAAMAHVRAAEADAKQARLLPNPILNVDIRYPASGSTPVELTLTDDLVAVLEQPREISAADNRLRGAAADAETTVLDSIAEVQTTYTQAQSIDAQLESISNQRGLLQKIRTVSADRVAAGEGMKLDVLTIDAQLAQLTVDSSDLQSQRIEQRMALARLVGEPRDAADWKLDPWQEPEDVRGGESAWVDAALLNRPEVHSKEWELASLKDEVDLTRFEPFQGDEVGAHGEHDPRWRVGPTITSPIPLFDMGQEAKAKAQAEAAAAIQELAQQRLEVIEDVRRDYQSYKVARATLNAAQIQLLPLVQEERRQADLAYQSGDADFTTLLVSETSLDQTMESIVELQEKVTLALIRLERSAGGAGVAAAVESAAPSTSPTTSPTMGSTTRPGDSPDGASTSRPVVAMPSANGLPGTGSTR